jgi:hypothetical protein
MAFSFTYPTPYPSTKGWGPGWPNCQTSKIAAHDVFAGGLRKEMVELTNLLVAEMKRRGFHFMDPGCWGYGCRGTKDSGGGTTDTPSFHSWGLALDINAPQNVFGANESESDLATDHRWVVALLRKYGFFWLGPAIGDWMHFSFCGNPADLRRMTRKAKADFAPAFVVKGKTFKKLGKALLRAKLLLQDGAKAVKVRRK